MPPSFVRYPCALAALVSSLQIANAAVAKTPSISGNGWVALGIIAVLIAGIWFLIMGALHVERRDATLGRSRRKGEDGWFGIFPAGRDDEEDAPDYHHDGGEASN
jgi:hypothetical protein